MQHLKGAYLMFTHLPKTNEQMWGLHLNEAVNNLYDKS